MFKDIFREKILLIIARGAELHLNIEAILKRVRKVNVRANKMLHEVVP